MTLPPFPVDDAALAAVEHSLDASLDFPEGSDEPVVVGAEYTLTRLLDFYSGFQADDRQPVSHTEIPDHGPVPVYDYTDQAGYTERDVIRALLHEVCRLRQGEQI